MCTVHIGNDFFPAAGLKILGLFGTSRFEKTTGKNCSEFKSPILLKIMAEKMSTNKRLKIFKFFVSEMATAAHMYNEMNFENHLMNQAYLHPGNSLGKLTIFNHCCIGTSQIV